MGWVMYYALLLAIYVAASFYSLKNPTAAPEVIKAISVAVSLVTALLQAVAKVNLKFYLFWQKFWVWWHGDQTALWKFSLRLDGNFAPDVIAGISNATKDGSLVRWMPEVISLSNREVRLKLDRTIHVHIDFEPESIANDGLDHILIRSDELEVSYARAREKIDKQIAPLLNAFIELFHPKHHSIQFDVAFPHRNPFFAFFVAHLKAEQVTHFNLVFRPDDFSRRKTDKVVVTQNALEITAVTTQGFAELAKAFVLLTADAARHAEG